MPDKASVLQGCFLGLAVGDAMGYTVDNKTLDEICTDYGPNGLLGYDLVNGFADVTSYTQLAAFTANGLLLALSHRKMQGRMAPLIRYISVAVREWSRSQHYCEQEKNHCWLSTVPQMKRRRCMDTWMLSTLSRETLGTMDAPVNRSNHPAALTEAIPIALLAETLLLDNEERDILAAKSVALTHRDPESFIAAAALAHALGLLLEDPTIGRQALMDNTLSAIQLQFGRDYPQTAKFWELAQLALTLSQSETITQIEAMEQLQCKTPAEVLAGVAYACATCHGDFDAAMITAVNHSGRSAAVGAITGALLGARLGVEALPEFYLESLEPVEALAELAEDLRQGCPMVMGSNLFDDDWDRKYLHAGF